MNVYERIVELDEEEMVEFLYKFVKDSLEQFARFIMPSKEGIREFLEREI